MLWSATIPFIACAAAHVQQDRPFVSPMFSDSMVLQRDKADAIWGWSTPGAKVAVAMGGKHASAVAGADGKWTARIGPFPAGGPYELAVSGPQTVSFKDVLVGDVWICSGQSNMEMGVGNLKDPAEVIAGANCPNLRLFMVSRIIARDPVPYSSGEWKVCSPESIAKDGVWGGFSAVGYFFGRKLNEDLNVPIGLIHTSWGGTPAEAWTEESALRDKLPEFRGQLKRLDDLRAGEKGVDPFDVWYRANDARVAGAKTWADPALDDSAWPTMTVPGYFQKAEHPEFVNDKSVVWLRKTIDLTAEQATHDMTIHFLVDDDDATWVNGEAVGSTRGYNIPRAYKVAKTLLRPGRNVITVRVTDTQAPGGIYGEPGSVFLLNDSGDKTSLEGEWRMKLGCVITDRNPFPVSVETNPGYPTVLFNGMIEPVAPFGIRGAIWYQGEANANRAYQYRRLLPTMIGSWRDRFNQGTFPFLIVQLAGFMHPPVAPGEDDWAELREAQWMSAKSVSNAGIATAVDIGEQDDIHPKNKLEVARRLALVAESQVYGRQVVSSGPSYRSMKIEGGSIRVSFDHADGGLVSHGDGPLRYFAIAGKDRKWVWADAKIDGSTVVVSSSDVPNPVAVRYSWAAFLDSNLYNGAGLPAFPFRTDQWTRAKDKP